MYTIAICDSSKDAADSLRISIHNVLDRLKIAHRIYYYKDSGTLYKILKKYPEKYNLLFLETELSPYRGIELAHLLRKQDYHGDIAFVAATADDVFLGYEVDACQYLLKPVEEKKLHHLFFKLSIKSLQQQSNQYLLLNFGTTYHKIRYTDILYIETSGRKVNIHTSSQSVTYPCKLSEMEELLPGSLFIRCHQSFILQIGAVSYLQKSQAHLHNGMEIPISRPYKDIVQQAFSH